MTKLHDYDELSDHTVKVAIQLALTSSRQILIEDDSNVVVINAEILVPIQPIVEHPRTSEFTKAAFVFFDSLTILVAKVRIGMDTKDT